LGNAPLLELMSEHLRRHGFNFSGYKTIAFCSFALAFSKNNRIKTHTVSDLISTLCVGIADTLRVGGRANKKFVHRAAKAGSLIRNHSIFLTRPPQQAP